MILAEAKEYVRRYGAVVRADWQSLTYCVQFPDISGTALIRMKSPLSSSGLLGVCKCVRDYNQDICRPLPK